MVDLLAICTSCLENVCESGVGRQAEFSIGMHRVFSRCSFDGHYPNDNISAAVDNPGQESTVH